MPTCIRCRKEMPDATPFCPFCGAKQERTRTKKKQGNGMGTAFKRRGEKTWTARVTIGFVQGPNGPIQKRREKRGFRTQTEALQYCTKLLEEQNAPRIAPTLNTYWELYERGEFEELSQSKQCAYKGAWKKLKRLHMKPVDKITVADLRDAVEGMNYYPAKDIKTLLTHLFNLASADGFASKELPAHIKLPKLQETTREPFTEDEQKRLWALYESGDKSAAIPLIMIYTGMMTGEMKALRADMIDWEESKIVGLGMKTKVRKESPIFLPDAIIPVLIDVSEGKKGRVFPWDEKRFYRTYYEALEKAECRKLTPYSCRHTTATALAISEGIAPQTIKKVMRWSTTKMLDRYAHPSDQDALEAANAIKKPL